MAPVIIATARGIIAITTLIAPTIAQHPARTRIGIAIISHRATALMTEITITVPLPEIGRMAPGTVATTGIIRTTRLNRPRRPSLNNRIQINRILPGTVREEMIVSLPPALR